MTSFKSTFLSGTFYIGVAKYTGILCQLIITAVLARILTPDDYGVIAIAMVFIFFFNTLSDIGIGVAVIQRKELTDDDLDHLYSLNVYIGIVLSSLFFASARFISDYYGNVQLLHVCQLLSLLILFTCARTVPMNLLYREKEFRFIAFSNLLVNAGSGVAAIFAALSGWGVYALVLSQVMSSLLLLVIFFLRHRRHFHLRVDLTPFKRVFSYSAYNFAGTIFIYFMLSIDKLLVGKFTGARALGYYEKSYSLVFLPINNITFVITPVLHPLFSEFQDNLKELERKFLKIIRAMAYISFPLSVIFFFVSKELVLVFYGNQWYPAIPPFQIMSLAISFLILDTMVGSIYNAANETKRGFYTMLAMSVVMIASVVVAIWLYNTIIAVAYAFLFAKIVGTLLNYYSLTHGLEGKFRHFLVCIDKPIIVSVILGGLMFVVSRFADVQNVFAALLLKSAIGAVLSLLLVHLLSEYNLFQLVRTGVNYIRR